MVKSILIDALVAALVVLTLSWAAYTLSFNRRFNSWREGRRTWLEIAKLRNKHISRKAL